MRAANDTRPAPSAQANMSYSKYLRLQRRAPRSACGRPPRHRGRSHGLEGIDALGKAHDDMAGAGGFEPLPWFLQVAVRIPKTDHQGHLARAIPDASADG